MECFKSEKARRILKGKYNIYCGFLYLIFKKEKKKKSRQEKKEVSEFTLFNERKVNILSIICIFEIKYVSLTT